MAWNLWKEKDKEFRRWTIPSFTIWVYWRFLTGRIIAEISSCKSLLDVGCGEGEFLDRAMESKKYGTVIGVDPNIQRLKLIQEKAIHKIRAVGENLPIKNCVVSAVIIKSTLDHVQNPRHVMKEICRVVTDNGKIYVFQGFGPESNTQIPSDTHMRYFTSNQLHQLFNSMDLNILRVKTFFSMRLKRILWFMPKIYDFLGRFFGHSSTQLIIASKKARSLHVSCAHHIQDDVIEVIDRFIYAYSPLLTVKNVRMDRNAKSTG